MATASVTLAPTSIPAERAAFGSPDWVEMDNETTGVTTATHAAATGKQHYIHKVVVSFSAAPTGVVTVQLKDGSTVIFQAQIPAATTAPDPFDFGLRPLRGTTGAAVTATATDAGVITNLWMCGATYPGP